MSEQPPRNGPHATARAESVATWEQLGVKAAALVRQGRHDALDGGLLHRTAPAVLRLTEGMGPDDVLRLLQAVALYGGMLSLADADRVPAILDQLTRGSL